MKEVEVATNWWVEALKDPQMDNGDIMQSYMMQKLTNLMTPLGEEPLNKFKEILSAAIKDKLSKGQSLSLGVDYQPEMPLDLYAESAGIPDQYFPVKTQMWIQPGCVSVSCGWGQPNEILYSTPEYWERMLDDAEKELQRVLQGDKSDPQYYADRVSYKKGVVDRQKEQLAKFSDTDLLEYWEAELERATKESESFKHFVDSFLDPDEQAHYMDDSLKKFDRQMECFRKVEELQKKIGK